MRPQQNALARASVFCYHTIMKIYVGHSRDFDFKNDLYEPLSKISGVDFIFPHENSDQPFNSKEALKEVDLMFAEVSFPSTGLGIELGWANLYNKPILAFFKQGEKISGSVKYIATQVVEYSDAEDLISKLRTILK